MRTSIVPIGNSKGIRIPSSLLKLCHLTSEVDLNIHGNTIEIRAVRKKPRSGWEQAFEEMHMRKEDSLLIEDSVDLNIKDWVW